ncbi:hypothetical protein BJX62DRAFT_244733 [Aspergillus germanicus]
MPRDLSIVRIAIVDAAGTVLMSSSALVHLSVVGAGRLIGSHNGDPLYDADNFAATNKISMFNGQAATILETREQPGEITLIARSDGIPEISVTIPGVEGGLYDTGRIASPGVNAFRSGPHSSPPESTPGASDASNPLEILQTYRGDASLVYCLCSPSTWGLVSQDFLTYVYPLILAVHIPTFLSSLAAHRTLLNRLFACLQASIFAIVNALLPSRFDHYKAVDPTLGRNDRITDKVHAVFRANDVFGLIKGPELQDEPNLTCWATVYLFGAAYTSLNLLHRSVMFRSHTYTIMLSMHLHLIKSYAGLNPIETQLRKEAVWLTLTGVIHSQVFGTMPDLWNSGMARRIRTDKLLPREIDDGYISETEVKEQPPEVLSLTAGFLAEKRILLDLLDLDYDNMPESPSIGNLEPETLTRESHLARASSTTTPAVLLERIRRLKYSLDDFNPSRGAASHDQSSPLSNKSSHTISDEAIELQRVDVYVTNYWAQNYLIERVLSLSSAARSSEQETIHNTRISGNEGKDSVATCCSF